MTKETDVKEVLLSLIQTPTVKRLLNDSDFLKTVAMQYDEYIKEERGYLGDEPNWDLDRFTIDKVAWEENNNAF